MEFIQSSFAYVMENQASIVGVGTAFIIFFDRLAKITPTNSDNKVVEALQRLFSVLGVRVQDNPGNGK